MSSGPVKEYTGISGVANQGGDPMTEDVNEYYAVKSHNRTDRSSSPVTNIIVTRRLGTSRGS